MYGKKSNQRAKRAVGAAAANLVEEGMTVGIGSGSTSACFITSLAARCRDGLTIKAVATSKTSEDLAKRAGIQLIGINDIDTLDIAIDGADEIDPKRRMIKGGGGALLREKLIASMAEEMVVIIDESKLVDKLGTFGLPVEIVPFAYKFTLKQLESFGYGADLREGVTTDNGNYIADLSFQNLLDDPEALDTKIRSLPGVVETGIFLNLAGRVLIGDADGQVEIRT